MYRDDNRSKYPYYTLDLLPDPVMWEESLEPYLRLPWTNRSIHCPSYKCLIARQVDVTIAAFQPVGSYAYNTSGTCSPNQLVGPADTYGLGYLSYFFRNWAYVNVPAVSDTNVRMPSEMFAISDSRVIVDKATLYPVGSGVDYMSQTPLQVAFAYPMRHGRNYNVLCCDGHIPGIRISDLFSHDKTARNWNNDNEPHPETWY